MTAMTKVLSLLKAKLHHWRSDVISFVKEVFGATPTDQQAELLSLLPTSRQIAIRSGHGTGKSTTLAWSLMWFLLCFPRSKVVCTAPSKRQLFDILWSEVYNWHSRSRIPELTSLLQIQSEIIRVGSRKDWFARAVAISVDSSPEEQAEALAGYHADNIMVIVDEASGVPDPVFSPLESYGTTSNCKILLASNPTRTTGYFYNLFTSSAGSNWTLLHWNSEDSPLVSRDWIETMRSRYGPDSPQYLIRVKGEFPPSQTEVLIPMEWLRRSVYTELPKDLKVPAIWGVDVAYMGSDESALVSRRGPYVDLVKSRYGLSPSALVEWIIEEIHSYPHPIKAICIDISGGLGVGPMDTLRRALGSSIPVIGVNVGTASRFRTEVALLRDELWFAVRTAIEYGTLFLPPNEKLIRQLNSVRKVYDRSGRRFKIESKKDIKKRKLPSPDLADALCLTYYLEPASVLPPAEVKPRVRKVASWRVA